MEKYEAHTNKPMNGGKKEGRRKICVRFAQNALLLIWKRERRRKIVRIEDRDWSRKNIKKSHQKKKRSVRKKWSLLLFSLNI